MKPWTEMKAACIIWQETRPAAQLVIPRFTPLFWHECDVLVVMKSGFWHEFEIKLSLADFRADRRKSRKHLVLNGGRGEEMEEPLLARYLGPNRFWYAVPEEIAHQVANELPQWAGLAVFKTWSNGVRSMIRQKRAPLRHKREIDPRVLEQARGVMIYRMWAALVRCEGLGEPQMWESTVPVEEPRATLFEDEEGANA